MDGLIIGLVQCFALVPGVSRSGATISAGLLRDLDRVTATRLSFFLGIPALTAAGAARGGQRARTISRARVGWGPTVVGHRGELRGRLRLDRLAAAVRRPATRSSPFVWYRVGLGLLLIAGLVTSVAADLIRPAS